MPRQMLTVDFARYLICLVRYLWFVKLCRRLRVLEPLPAGVSKNTVMHNLKGLRDLAVARSHQIIRPLSTIDRVRHGRSRHKVLLIGPRSEGEIFNLIGHGFSRHNVRGLDLISYSPFVDVGDMHAMPYETSTMDIIVLGWVIAYSEARDQVAREVLRVAKNGAVIAIGVSHNPRSNDEIENDLGYLPGAPNRIDSTAAILSLFGNSVRCVYFSQDVDPDLAQRVCSIISIFSITKND